MYTVVYSILIKWMCTSVSDLHSAAEQPFIHLLCSFPPETSSYWGWLQSPHNSERNLINLTVTPEACDHCSFPSFSARTQEGDVELNLCYSDELTIEQSDALVITKHRGHSNIFQLCHTGLSV